jgi:hypothetical protein
MRYIILGVSALVIAILYRAGGMSKDNLAKPRWIPKWLRCSIIRDIGCSIVTLAVLYYLGAH